MSLQSTAVIAKAKTKSLRATIPEEIVHHLDLKPGDRLEWSKDEEGSQRAVIVTKVLAGKSMTKIASKKEAEKLIMEGWEKLKELPDGRVAIRKIRKN
jgi:bifunctional DNA-binding transcriptional regulator/antitoxin component of YhaV-PrlF toxin-antitoxin module